MPNIAKILKDELSRVSRRETKKALASATRPAAGLRRTTADLKRRVARLEKELAAVRKALGRAQGTGAAAPEPAATARVTARSVRSLRRRLRLSGQEFARLLGITAQVVYKWEKASGALRMRAATRSAVLAARGFGAREAKRRLEAMAAAKKPAKPPARKRAAQPAH